LSMVAMVAFHFIALIVSIGGAAGHAMMTKPVSRNKGTLDISGCTFAPNRGSTDPHQMNCIDHVSWFCGTELADAGSCTTKPGPQRTIPDDMLSSPVGYKPIEQPGSVTPWEAPGSSMPLSPCGSSLGQLSPQKDGRDLPKSEGNEVWAVGTVQSVGWSLWANHGGGYAWRLCPASEELTEECFQKTPLDFADEHSILEWVNGTQVPIPAKTTSTGTVPMGSQWRRNPIPSTEFCGLAPCQCPPGFSGQWCPAFEPPCPGCWGAESPGIEAGSRHAHQDFSILDNVVVPKTLAPGEYVLQWRWDNELKTQQVWTNCADVNIVASETVHV